MKVSADILVKSGYRNNVALGGDRTNEKEDLSDCVVVLMKTESDFLHVLALTSSDAAN